MGKSGAMVPLVQLELSQFPAAIHDPLGDGLLQLWYDPDVRTEFMRIVSLGEANGEEMTPFNWTSSITKGETFPLPITGAWALWEKRCR